MVAKSELKFVKSLQQKKCRSESGLFVVEGVKSVNELLDSPLKLHSLYATDPALIGFNVAAIGVSPAELSRMSGLKTPNALLAVFEMPKAKPVDYSGWVLALDQVRDPGNLGTIIRLCDWFDIRHLVCAHGTVDCYNPKVLQATMGSITRVNVVYEDLEMVLGKHGTQAYGAFMTGENLYKAKLSERGILVMGNEANGVSAEVEAMIQGKLSIPQYGAQTTESLNVAMATGIILAELKRKLG
ncbi:TrmH family RNA methyltransferase [Sediminicola luteus]|uniref:RNA methyltransferase n=1 Tax=Sediminicola luteus TaxID=319238 RepID=A0A2A4G6Q0_9FLAO|nr:RNA methyltransferase [Sediminicola luteus]PCE63412.1 RNA methyltransferase [Sediminicola luteus]